MLSVVFPALLNSLHAVNCLLTGVPKVQHRSSGHGRRQLQTLEGLSKSPLCDVMCCYITDTLLALPTREGKEKAELEAGVRLGMWEHMAVWNRYKYKKRVSAKGESPLDLEMVPRQQPILRN